MVKKLDKNQLAEKIENILKSHQSPYERKIALFNLVKNLEVGDFPPEKKKRVNYLLQGHLYNELAKQSMDEYKKTTGERSKSKQFWRYTFLDIQTGKEDWFLNNYRIGYIPNLSGKLKLEWDKKEELNKGTKKVDDNLTRRPIKFKHQDLVEFVEGLKKSGVPYKEIATGLKRTKTLREMSDYIFDKTDKRFCVATIFLVLKKIKYSYQVIPYRHPQQKANLVDVIEFMERANKLPPRQILSTDESGHPLNLASRRGWGLKGQKITDHKPSYDTVKTEVFANFLNNVKLPNKEKYYLLLDNIRFHHAKKVKELLTVKNIEPRYIVASNPYLNPVEEIFNVIK
ncbi:20686_t:CDS:2, partial [Funneliformis geosporum]